MGQYKAQYIPIGRELDTNKTVYFVEQYFGVSIVAGKTRYGKSSIVKQLYCLLSKRKKVVIIDYSGEHKKAIMPNFMSEHYIAGVEDLVVVENFGFMLSDFDRPGDWVSLGMSSLGAELITKIVESTELHNNDVDEFFKILLELPTTEKEVAFFTESYPTLDINFKINASTKTSIVSRFSLLKTRGIFISKNDIESGRKQYIEDFTDVVLNNSNVCINLNLRKGDKEIARAYVGKILDDLSRILSKQELCIIFEEADILFPSEKDLVSGTPSSVSWIGDYVLKYQKYGVSLIFVTQDLSLLYEDIVSNYHNLIIGRLPKKSASEFRELTNKLKWLFEENYREFLYVRAGMEERPTVFVPFDCPCLLDR